MGPPILIDNKNQFALSQMTAIVLYLMDALALAPADPAQRAMTIKVVNDANDVLDDITLDGGRLMWTQKRWDEYIPRLKKWMSLFEEVGRRHHLTAKAGFLLGGEAPGVADIVTATLWSTMTDRFPKIEAMFEETAPHVAALTRRVAAIAAARRSRAKGAAGLRRRLLQRPDRKVAAQGAARLSVASALRRRSFATLHMRRSRRRAWRISASRA